MDINLQIDRLILEDFPLDFSPRQRRELKAAIEAELVRLFQENGLPVHLQNGGTMPKLPLTLSLSAHPDPSQMGQQIAQNIHRSIDRNIHPNCDQTIRGGLSTVSQTHLPNQSPNHSRPKLFPA